MLEFVYNFILGGFSIYGAVLLGRWVLGRGWHWAAKAVALIVVASLITSGVSLLVGGSQDDLRVFTEVLATAGAVVAAVAMMGNRRARRNPWVQYGVPVALLLFLAITWREQIADVRHGTVTLPTPSSMVPAPSSPTAPPKPAPPPASEPALDMESFCRDPGISLETWREFCQDED